MKAFAIAVTITGIALIATGHDVPGFFITVFGAAVALKVALTNTKERV